LLLRGAHFVIEGGGNLRARGAATASLVHQRRGTVVVVAMQPVHHRLRPPPGAFGDFSGAVALNNLMQGKEAFAAAGMSRTQGKSRKSAAVWPQRL
jgi:hypothetical protein